VLSAEVGLLRHDPSPLHWSAADRAELAHGFTHERFSAHVMTAIAIQQIASVTQWNHCGPVFGSFLLMTDYLAVASDKTLPLIS
jgi:hypothetical protein